MLLRGRYRVLGRAGAGGAGTVWRALDICAGTEVALKTLFPRDGDERLVASLRSEFGVLAHLRRAPFARVFDFGRLPPATELGGPDGRAGYFLTREFIDGRTLDDAAAEVSPREATRLCGEIALALDGLHSAGMLHGDLKPGNVIVEPSGRVRLIDFGLARAFGQSHGASGTPAYVAPEILRGQSADRRADLYALGIVLYQLLTGALPVRGATAAQMIDWHLHGPPLRLAAARPDLPAAFDGVVARLAEREPDRRYATAREAAAALFALAGAAPPAQRDFAASPPPLVGKARAEALSALDDRVRDRLFAAPRDTPRAERAAATLVLLEGERGSGRSTLLRELAWRVQLAGGEAITAEFREGDARPLGALGALVDQTAALAGRPSPLVEDGGGAARYRLHQEVSHLLAQVGRKTPLLLVLDDLERATADARSLLRYLRHVLADAPVLVVASVAAGAAVRAHLADTPTVALGPLEPSDVAEILAATGGRADTALAARVHRHTGGVASFVIEVAERLAREGGDPARVALPSTLEEALLLRLDALPAAAVRAAETLAVAARPIAIERLAEALPALEQAGLVERVPPGIVLRAGAAAQLLLARMPRRRRQELHRRAARDAQEHEHALACRHWLAAGEIARARRLIGAALDALLAQGARAAALERGEAVLAELAERDPQRRRLMLRVAELARLGGALATAERLARSAGGVDGLVLQGRVRAEAGDPTGAVSLLERAVRAGPRRADALRALAEVHVRRGDPARAEPCCRKALALHPLPAEEARVRTQLGLALAYRGHADLAQAELARACEAARTAADRAAEIAALSGSALVHFRQGELGAARTRWSEALDAARAAGDVERIASLTLNLAAIAFHRGELGRNLSGLQECLRLVRAVGAEMNEVLARVDLGHAYLTVGLHEQARAELETARDAARRLGLRRHEACALQVLALVRAARGETGGAREGLDQAAGIFAELGDPVGLGELEADRADVALRAGDRDGALRAIAAGASGAPDDLALRLDALRLRAAALAPAAERGDAARGIADALERARAKESPPLELDLRAAAFELETARGRDTDARAHASAALRLLEAMAADLPAETQNAFWQDERRRALRHAAGARGNAIGEADTQMGLRPGAPGVEERFFRILEINRQLGSELDPERLLERLMDAAVELTGAERGFLLLAPSDGGEMTVEVARNLDRRTLGAESYSRSIAERVCREGEPIITVSAHDDPRFRDYLSVHQMRLESVLAIPVRVRGRVAGVLYLESRFARGPFTPEDLRLLQAFGDQAAIALSNARLLAENVARARELERAKREIETLAEERRLLLDRRTGELERAQRSLAEMRSRLTPHAGLFGLIGRSEPMLRVFSLIERVAATEVPALIVGESGTGKEMVARALHENGPRAGKPLISINCAAIPETLLESELFGHVRGAFTGAERDRQGLFAAARGGTLFLDEIGDMPARMQATLLRALQEKRIRPLGGRSEVEVDVRIVAATQRPLEELVAGGRFREDLLYRLSVVEIRLPPLRDRALDIPLLCDHLLEAIAARTGAPRKTLTREAARLLMNERWPGNVRQLEHALMNACVLSDGDVLHAEDFSLGGTRAGTGPTPAATIEQRQAEQRRAILAALAETGWNRSRAAALVGLPRRTFYRRLREYQVL
ncbi:MAG: sigma 54-interacting transcriptional regulator [Myxococcota bacterium]